MKTIYSIGFITEKLENLIDIFIRNDINLVVDIRSNLNSLYYPEYNSDNLDKMLRIYGIKYLALDSEFGEVREETNAYSLVKFYDSLYMGIVDYRKVYSLKAFEYGYEIVKDSINNGFNVCFLSEEVLPHYSHRGIMVSEYFYRLGFNIKHIISNDHIINHEDIYDELESVFEEEKRKFLELYHKEISEISYSTYDIFGNQIEVDSNITFWYEFFSHYTNEKAIYLQNLLIGYKKGV